MAEPFLAEIRMVSFNFAPKGWALCNGQFLPINQNQALFSLLGTTFGGNGQTNFALPDLRGRVPLHVSNTFYLGQQSGETAHTLSIQELPTHTHLVAATANSGSLTTPATNTGIAASTARDKQFSSDPPTALMAASTVSNLGGSQAHPNMPPYLTINFIIALQGIFPSQN
jgi:microcystin-dependent protein